jgi:pyruvate formate lyase activating enzyme
MKNIRGFVETSFVDWPGKMCSVVFVGGCNFRCPFCHNHPLVLHPETLPLIPFAKVLDHLKRYEKWLGGICISGGEPTLNPDLPGALMTLKKKGWAVKLDTNGSQPQVIEDLLAQDLVGMISMDVKAALDEEDKYNRCAGVSVDLDAIKASIELIRKSGMDYEFRMTVVPSLHSQSDIRNWAAFLVDKKSSPHAHLKLQNFNPQSTLDPDFMSENSFPAEIFEQFQERFTHLS